MLENHKMYMQSSSAAGEIVVFVDIIVRVHNNVIRTG